MHKLLLRQLKRLGLDETTCPDPQKWRQLLEHVDKAYAQIDQDRYLLERSLAISSQEMRALYDQLKESSETRIAHEREKLKSVITAIGDGVCSMTPEGQVLFINPAGEQLLGWTESQLAGKVLPDLIELAPAGQPPEHPGDGIVGFIGLAHGKPVRDEDAHFRRKDGTLIPVSYVLNPIIRDECPIGYVLVFRDISERKQAEQEIIQSRERLRLIYNAANDGIFVVDPTTERIIEVNPQAAKMLGYTLDELAGMSVQQIHPDEMKEFHDFGQTVVSDGTCFTQELSCTTSDGTKLPAEISASRLRMGNRTLILAMVRDITDRKQVEQALREAKEAAETSNQAKSDFPRDHES